MKKVIIVSVYLFFVVTCGDLQAQSIQNITQHTSHATIQIAINVASSGDTITVADSTYVLSTTITINKSITVLGASESGTIINATANGTGYGISISASNVTVSGFTILPPLVTGHLGTSGGGGYAIHVSNTPFTISNVTITHVIVKNGNRTCIDLNTVDNATVSYVTTQNSAYGNGVSLSGVHGANVSHVTTGGNAWGGIAVYCSQQSVLGSDNINIDGSTCTITEYNKIYAQDEFGAHNTNVTVVSYDYNIKNSYNDTTSQYTFYQNNLPDAVALATTFINAKWPGSSPSSYIRQISNGAFQVGSGMRIQTAVNTASSGEIINVSAGTFTEQVSISKNITLIGSGKGITNIVSPSLLTNSFTTAYDGTISTKKAIITAHDTSNVVMKNLTVDGKGFGNGNYQFTGIGFYRAGGTVDSVEVKGMREAPANGNQHGAGVYISNDSGVVRSVTISNCFIHDYQKGGIVLNGAMTVGTANYNVVTGLDPVLFIAQNGIQFGFGASGTASHNTVTGNVWTGKYPGYGTNDPISDPNSDASAGILAYMPGTNITIADNSLTANQFGVAVVAAPGAMPGVDIHDNVITGLAHTGYAYPVGIGIWSSDQWTPGFGGGETATTANIQNNTMTDHDYGIVVFDYTPGGAVPHATVHRNAIINNGLFGVWSNVATDVAGNWWGNASGPRNAATNPIATGDSVTANVEYSPWWNKNYVGDSHATGWSWTANGNIQSAINTVSPGDTLNITQGVSSGSLTIPRNVILKFATSPDFDSVNVSNGNLSLSSDVTVSGTLTLTNGNIITGSTNRLILDTTASVPVESDSGRIIGTVEVKPHYTGTGAIDILGLTIQPGSDDLGHVGFVRKSGDDGVVTVGGNSGVAMTWQIEADHPPVSGRTVQFRWFPQDDNGVDISQVNIYRNDGSGWRFYDGPFNASGIPRQVTVNVIGFSSWTVGSANVPLAVELTQFQTTAQKNDALLTWTTSTEVNNYGFEVERRIVSSLQGVKNPWKKVGFVPGSGNRNSPKEYSYTDYALSAGRYAYRLKQMDNSGIFKYSHESEIEIAIPLVFALNQNYPNPFNPATTIAFDIPNQSLVTLKIYDLMGREVAVLVNEEMPAGSYSKSWNASSLATGVYYYRMIAGSFTSTKRLVLMK
jgi:hypothetical protein